MAELRRNGMLISQSETPAIVKAALPSESSEKIVHFVRHGQGYHNLMKELYSEISGKAVDSTGSVEQTPATNPYMRPEIVDSPLTQKGRNEAKETRKVAREVKVDLVMVSPLRRAAETARIAFADHLGGDVPWLFHEDIREQYGKHTCDKRRDTEDIVIDFPNIDASELTALDEIWTHAREPKKHLAERGARFIKWLQQRPEKHVAVVGHSSFLFTLLNSVVDCGGEESLSRWFKTGELRTMGLTWAK